MTEPEEHDASELLAEGMRLFAADIRVRDERTLTDMDAVRALMTKAATDGGATILGEEFVGFPNGAFTGVLVLAQSHLSVHTWPEVKMANVDLLTYGSLDGRTILEEIADGLGADATNTSVLWRGVPR